MCAALTAGEKQTIRLELEQLNSAFAYHLDHNEIEALVDLFTADALYTNGDRKSEGREAIEQLFRNRTAGGPRTSRHMYSGLRLSIESSVAASGTSVCMSFAADGLPPLPAKPFLVADFVDRYRREEDGRWRIAERHIERVFVGETG
jgi:ketosteroid isomerase-like protein